MFRTVARNLLLPEGYKVSDFGSQEISNTLLAFSRVGYSHKDLLAVRPSHLFFHPTTACSIPDSHLYCMLVPRQTSRCTPIQICLGWSCTACCAMCKGYSGIQVQSD